MNDDTQELLEKIDDQVEEARQALDAKEMSQEEYDNIVENATNLSGYLLS